MRQNQQNDSYCFFFLCVVIVCAIAILAFYGCHKSHMVSLERIITCQTEQADLMDSSLMNFHQSMKELSKQKEDAMSRILADSVLAKLPKLSAKESQKIAKYVETAIAVSMSEQLHNNAITEYESLILSNRWNQLQSDTKALLELEMSKIQNEHETLGIWAAILTVVFLIFSFYSLFKTDDMVKQGQEGLDKLTELKREAGTELDALKEKGDKKIENFDIACKDAIKNAQTKVQDKLESVDAEVNRAIRTINSDLDQKVIGIDNTLKEKQKEIETLYENANNGVNILDQKRNQLLVELNKLEARLTMLQQKYNSINLDIQASKVEETV